jgi:hypothetical protein
MFIAIITAVDKASISSQKFKKPIGESNVTVVECVFIQAHVSGKGMGP